MRVVPVLDLLHGVVVHARRGDRKHYLPLVSALGTGSDAPAVARRLCEHCATDTLYVADLDALQGGAVQHAVLASLLDVLPNLQLWLDAGFRDASDLAALQHALGPRAARVTPVLASESLTSRTALSAAREVAPDALLSLDRRGDARLDPAGLWDAPALWPRRLIVMTLERVGSDAGPDLDTLAAVRSRAPQAELYGAGGVRDASDLATAAAAGAAGWLIASALHDGRLPPVAPPAD